MYNITQKLLTVHHTFWCHLNHYSPNLCPFTCFVEAVEASVEAAYFYCRGRRGRSFELRKFKPFFNINGLYGLYNKNKRPLHRPLRPLHQKSAASTPAPTLTLSKTHLARIPHAVLITCSHVKGACLWICGQTS